MSNTTIGKAPHAPPGRPAPAPTSRATRAASAKAPVAATARASAEAATLRRQLRADVAEALGAPPPVPSKTAGAPTRGAACSTKAVSAPAKPAATKTRAARAVKTPVPLPDPRQPPAKAAIKFPKLPVQARAARYEGPSELQESLTQYRKFVSVARMVAEVRKLTVDERHQVERAKARIREIRELGWSGVR